MMNNVEYFDLPMNSEGRNELAQKEVGNLYPDVQDRGDCVLINFVEEEQTKRASAENTRVGTLENFKIGFVTNVKEMKPELPACKV